MPKYETDLRQRARFFAVAAYRLSREIRQSYPALRNYADQMADAAGSIGANLAESEGLSSRRKEFIAMTTSALKKLRPPA